MKAGGCICTGSLLPFRSQVHALLSQKREWELQAEEEKQQEFGIIFEKSFLRLTISYKGSKIVVRNIALRGGELSYSSYANLTGLHAFMRKEWCGNEKD